MFSIAQAVKISHFTALVVYNYTVMMALEDKMSKKGLTAEQVLDTALLLAEQSSWQNLQLHDIATALDTPLITIHEFYPDKEALSNAWFARAETRMLKVTEQENFYQQSVAERLKVLIIRYIKALAEHKRVTKEMMSQTLSPRQLGSQLPALMQLHKTVEWMQQAAHGKHDSPIGLVEETGLMGILVMSLLYWTQDNSPHDFRTKNFIHERMSNAEHVMNFVSKFMGSDMKSHPKGNLH